MSDDRINVLIVDDERAVCDLLREELAEHSCACAKALDGVSALQSLAEQDFQIVLLDIKLPGISGMELLREIRLHYSSTIAIMLTAVNDVDTAVKAMKLGAADYIIKPFDLDRVLTSIDYALATVLETSLTAKHASEMDAIAFGVEQRRELLDGHWKFVTQATAEIARGLGIDEGEIQGWVANRDRLDSERKRSLKASIEKLRRSPLAQTFLGASDLYLFRPEELRN